MDELEKQLNMLIGSSVTQNVFDNTLQFIQQEKQAAVTAVLEQIKKEVMKIDWRARADGEEFISRDKVLASIAKLQGITERKI